MTDSRSLRGMDLLKAELLATVSHELRSPLASVKGYAATLLRHERRISREERHEFLLAITEASDRLAVVIDRLLEISQLDTDAITMKPSTVDLVYLVREALTASEQRFIAS
ncbi:MAG: PAS domain-containing sensor histidine kinase, partial [Chloroflexi bacterium]